MTGENKYIDHRKRMRERYLSFGFDACAHHEILEILLFYALPRKDTSPLAKRLLEEYGSLESVLNASYDELVKMPGIGASAALLLNVAGGIRNVTQTGGRGIVLSNTESIAAYARELTGDEPAEVVYLLALDADERLILPIFIARGSENTVKARIRDITYKALNCNAVYAVLTHNHPTGSALPGQYDYALTKTLATSLELVGIRLRDHIIVSMQGYYSFWKDGKMDAVYADVAKLTGGKP